jgi:Mn-containing catalase
VLLEKTDQLLNQVAPSLMSVDKMPAAVEQATIDGAE